VLEMHIYAPNIHHIAENMLYYYCQSRKEKIFCCVFDEYKAVTCFDIVEPIEVKLFNITEFYSTLIFKDREET
jgi:hypothetical protein